MTLMERFDALDEQLTSALDNPEGIVVSQEDGRRAAIALQALLVNRAAAKAGVEAVPAQIAS